MTGGPAAPARRDDGLSLLELVVAMGISSILIALVVSMFVSGSRAVYDQEASTLNARLASTSMNEVTRIVRAGTEIPVRGSSTNLAVFSYAGAETIVMYSFIDAETSSDPAPLKVQFARNAANELVETRWAGYHKFVGYWDFRDASTERIIARSLMPPVASSPLFTYYDKTGARLTPASGASLTSAQIRNIASVQVTMQVQGDQSGRVAPVQIQNMVGLPNLGVARVEVR